VALIDEKPAGVVSPAPPRAASEKVCFIRPARKARRTHTPADLRRIYRYVVGNHGWGPATCAILQESGIAEGLDDVVSGIGALNLCDSAVDLSSLEEYVPDEAAEVLGVDQSALDALLSGCNEDDPIAVKLRAMLAILVIIWGLWRRISASRVWRFVLRRFALLTVLGFILDRVAALVEKLYPAAELVASLVDELNEVCSDGENEG
jgi:hypothetical protein